MPQEKIDFLLTLYSIETVCFFSEAIHSPNGVAGNLVPYVSNCMQQMQETLSQLIEQDAFQLENCFMEILQCITTGKFLGSPPTS